MSSSKQVGGKRSDDHRGVNPDGVVRRWRSCCSNNGYTVHGIRRRSSSFNSARTASAGRPLLMHHGDMNDATNLTRIVQEDAAYRNLQFRRTVQRSSDLRDAGVYSERRDLGPLQRSRILGIEKRRGDSIMRPVLRPHYPRRRRNRARHARQALSRQSEMPSATATPAKMSKACG